MTAKRDLKRRVRERQARTGESYTTALRHVLAAREGDDEVTDPGAAQVDAGDEHLQRGGEAPAAPIDVDEAVDFTEAAAALDMRCRVLVFQRLLERADPQRVLTAVRDTLVASKSDPDTELLRKLVFQGKAHDGPRALTREPRFRQRIEAGFTGVSNDGRVLAIHVEGHKGIVTALGALWRNTSTLVLMSPDDFVAKLVMPPGTIQDLGERYGVPIPATARSVPGVQTVFLIFNGRRYPITVEPFVIGRHARSDLQIKDGHISRKHAAVFYRQGAHYLVDLGSQAGIEYRGLKIENKRIEEGDMFQIREYALRFTYLETDG